MEHEEDNMLKEKVKFGEVVERPPSFSAKPKMKVLSSLYSITCLTILILSALCSLLSLSLSLCVCVWTTEAKSRTGRKAEYRQSGQWQKSARAEGGDRGRGQGAHSQEFAGRKGAQKL